MKKNLYIQFETSFFDKIINKKRVEMISLVKKHIKISQIKDLLDIGIPEDYNRAGAFLKENNLLEF